MSAKEQLLERFLDGTLALKTANEICKILQLPYREKSRLLDLLDKLCEDGEIYQNNGGRYGTTVQLGLIKGKISGNERGFAFLVPEDKESYPNDFFLPKKSLHGALHGDTVLIEKVYGDSDDEGNVVQIIERGYENIVKDLSSVGVKIKEVIAYEA